MVLRLICLASTSDRFSVSFFMVFVSFSAVGCFICFFLLLSFLENLLTLWFVLLRLLFFLKSSTLIFLCKVSASGVLQGSSLGWDLPRDFFQVFGVQLRLLPKTLVSEDENNHGHPLPLPTFFLPAPFMHVK